MKLRRERWFWACRVWAAAGFMLLLSGCYVDASLFKRALRLPESGAAPARSPIYHHAGWIIARASLHNHTIYSDGKYTPEDLLELARQEGMAVLAITDHREGKICLDKIFCVQSGGVEKIGYQAYWERLEPVRAEGAEKGIIVLRGVEVSPPVLVNTGRFPYFVLWGQFNHFTVYGVAAPEVLENMPVTREISLRPEPVPDETIFQEFVDYLTAHGAIVHAVHVEKGQDEWLGGIHIITPAPIRNILLHNLTGFSILPEGWHEKVGGPGGLWDTVLLEYLAGLRERPLWANGDADFHGPKGSLANATTLFYMREFTEEEVYKCLREGRMVALQGEAFQDSFVVEWWVSDAGPPAEAVMLGEEVRLAGTPVVRFALNHPVAGVRTRLIRNGRVVHEIEGAEFTFVDREQGDRREPAFYRVEVIGPRTEGKAYESETMPESELFVNPIFVRFVP